MEVPQVTTSGRSVLVQWLLDKSQSLLNKVSFLQVEIRTKGRDVWVVGKRVETEVKAVIFKDLLPGRFVFFEMSVICQSFNTSINAHICLDIVKIIIFLLMSESYC